MLLSLEGRGLHPLPEVGGGAPDYEQGTRYLISGALV